MPGTFGAALGGQGLLGVRLRDLRAKNAIVTGASRGMGVEISSALAREGANLALVARTEDALQRAARDLARFGTKVLCVVADITRAEARVELVRRVEAELGQIDILVNNAGVAQWIQFKDQSEADVRRIIETNLTAPMLLTRQVLPAMIERGAGHIVNISSASGLRGIPYEAVYSGTKAGLLEFTHAVRMELAGTGVGLSVVCPVYFQAIGGFARQGVSSPRLIGSVSPERLSKAVVRAIHHNSPQVVLWRGPTRPVLAAIALSPVIGDLFLRAVGVVRLNRSLAGVNGSPPSASWDETAHGAQTHEAIPDSQEARARAEHGHPADGGASEVDSG